jgi:hypothetical protein
MRLLLGDPVLAFELDRMLWGLAETSLKQVLLVLMHQGSPAKQKITTVRQNSLNLYFILKETPLVPFQCIAHQQPHTIQ